MPLLKNGTDSDEKDLNVANRLQQQEVDFDKYFNKKTQKNTESNGDDSEVVNQTAEEDSDKNSFVKNYNSDAANEISDAENNTDASMIKDSGSKEKKNQKSTFASKGAAMALAGGGVSMLVLVGMVGNLLTSLLNNITELFKNENTSTRTNMVYRNAVSAHQCTKGKCDGKVQVFCRFGNISEKKKSALERAGFTVIGDEKDSFGRYKVQGYIAPDGTRIENGQGLTRWANATSDNARIMNLATKGKVAFWWNQKYNDVQKRWGIDKAKKLLGITREENERSLDRNTNGAGEGDGDPETRARRQAEDQAKAERDKAIKETTDRIGKAGYIAAAVTASCGIYNMSHKLTAYAKNYHVQQMIKYANVFLNTADRIKDLGDVEPEVISYAGKIMTDQDPREKVTIEDAEGNPVEVDNPDYRKTATDSQAYETVTHGDTQELSGSAQKFRPGGFDGKTSWLSDIDQYTKSIEIAASGANPSTGVMDRVGMIKNLFGSVLGNGLNTDSALKDFAYGNPGTITEGRQSIRYACIGGEDAAITGYVVMCGLAVGALFTGAGTVPGAGTLAGCAGALGCQLSKYTFDVCGSALDYATDMIVKASDELGITDKLLSYVQSAALGSFTKYTDAGNAWGAGNAYLAESTSMGYGLRPAKDAVETQKFIASTNNDIAMEEKIAYEDARDTPFDLNNPHSFLGTAVRKTNLVFDEKTPVFSSLLSLVGLIPRSLAYNDTTYATYSQPIQDATKRYSCDDPDLLAIGIKNADKFCSTVGITPEAELAAARTQANDEGSSGDDDLIARTLTYMTTPQEKNETEGGTYDDSFCEVPGADAALPGLIGIIGAVGDLGDEESPDAETTCKENREKSKQASVDETGKTITDSQYDRYEKYCTEQRKDPWGTFSEPIQNAKSNRDIDWWTGEQCLKDTPMMVNFRTYFNICSQVATMDETAGCWTDEPMTGSVQAAGNVTTSECSQSGNTTAIYTCALKYDNYRYLWSGGHGGNAQEFISKFKAGGVPEWEAILDCSGLVRMAFVEAMGIEDQAYVAPDGYGSSKYWEKIPMDQAKQGDIVTSSGHVAIIEANDVSAKSFKIFHASTSSGDKENNIKHGNQSYSGAIATYRAKGMSV